ncbi:hypothetical protein [Mucilaginibacter lacusdianchii]|uniref:hypothetical protein n=1 Tax=Mucilaginibacter lacusdianchii TaxID=2684211 RepID=UPI00131BEF52|nr:hypothetical protein [Mucilaginibacter sp. JXJ CY 39]
MKRLIYYTILLFALCGISMTVPQFHYSVFGHRKFAAQQSYDPGYPGDVPYGVNNFSTVTVRELPSGLTRFFVPGNLNARHVQLSGSFNRWTTQKGVMTRTDSGWVSDITLEPGVYAYKYIINGRWSRDVTNNLKEDDGWGDYNSIYYRYNYTFRLGGFATAHRVAVAGRFNNWNANEIILSPKGKYWERQIYLHEGTHLYRFMVDGRWITDPANPAQTVQNNTASSILNFGESVNFKLNGYSNAKNVFIACDFNNWRSNTIRMQKAAGGWALPYVLPKGNYQYKFIVDGQWITDPFNPHTTVIEGNQNSFLSVAPNHTFTLNGYNGAKEVRIAGDFNDWNPDGYTLAHSGNQWHISLRLKSGKYRYKFIVDGNWILDPGNRQWEQNEYNTGNSVLWID